MQTRSSPSLVILHNLAQQAAIKDYDKMPKQVLFRKLSDSFDLNRLQRAASRRHKIAALRGEAIESRRKGLQKINKATAAVVTSHAEVADTSVATSSDAFPTSCFDHLKSTAQAKFARSYKIFDPVMRSEAKPKNIWTFVRPNGTMIQFNVETLVDYMLATGDFRDPEARIPFSDDDLREIDRVVNAAGLKRESVLAAKNQPKKYDDLKFRRDALCGLERLAGEIVTEMLEIAENYHYDDAQIELVTRALPEFLDYLRQIRDVDPIYASQCVAHWTQYLRGPPNKPYADRSGLLNVLIRVMRSAMQTTNSPPVAQSSVESSVDSDDFDEHEFEDDDDDEPPSVGNVSKVNPASATCP